MLLTYSFGIYRAKGNNGLANIALYSYPLQLVLKFLNSKPCYAFNSDPKMLKSFLNDANPSELCYKYFFCPN